MAVGIVWILAFQIGAVDRSVIAVLELRRVNGGGIAIERDSSTQPFPVNLPMRKETGVSRVFILGESAAQGTPAPQFGFGRILEVNLPRPRTRQQLLDHPAYNEMRAELIDFLAACDHK